MEDILIIDDSEHVAAVLALQILPPHGYGVRIAATGWEGLVQLRQRRPDLVLLDYELPDTTGLQMLRRIAEIDATLPVILMTAHGSEQIAVEAFQLGARNYLVKPFAEEDVLAALEHALREWRLQREKDALTASLQQRVRELSTLSTIGKSVTALLDLEQLLERIVEASVYLTRSEAGMLLLTDSDSKELYLRAAKNLGEERVQTFRVPISDSIAGRVISTRQPVRLGRSSADGGLKVKTGYLAQSLLQVPLLLGGEAIGVLGVSNARSARLFSEHDQYLLSALADHASVALQNARLFKQVSEEQARYRDLVAHANDLILTLDSQLQITSINRFGQQLLGFNVDQLRGMPLSRLSERESWGITAAALRLLQIHQQERSSFDLVLIDKEGKPRYTEVNAHLLRTATSPDEIVCIARDVTERKTFEAQLRHLAFHDPLSNLPNRALFMERLTHALERSQRNQSRVAVVFLDLDNFKVINDSLGHQAGDLLLCAVAHRLQRCVRPADTVARLGGDEFILLLEDIREPVRAIQIVERLQQELRQAVRVHGHEVFTTASIGLAISTPNVSKPDDLVRDADLAMYQAKSLGKAQYALFEASMNDRAMERLRLETDLRRAVERDEFVVYYQPVIELESGRIVEVEALVRWEHPERGQVPPSDFIPIAEETGLILPLGRFVLETACRQGRAWQLEYPSDMPLTISVNLSPRQFQHPSLLETISQTLASTGLDASALKLEITESMMMHDGESSAALMNELKRIGVQLAIDDFGTGYCSLSYLKRFPIDTLKIDRTFINGLGLNSQDTAIVQAVIAFAKALGLSVTGEGIETEQQMEQLSALDCNRGQGYYFGRPLPHAAIGAMLSQADNVAALPEAA